MGVLGLARLLKEEGWLPSDTSCRRSLWRPASLLTEDEARITRIPPHSTLALDGNGLAYYLHHVAYSRYFDQVTGGTSSSKTSSCSCRTKNLSSSQVTRLLPQYMPLAVLEEVTHEFVTSLERNQIKLVVYWDGPGRRMKAATLRGRKEVRDTEWSHLRQYCEYGVVPRFSNTTLCRKDWLYHFPITRLLMQQVRFTLQQFKTITMVDCEEEADREVAKAACFPDTYCVGMDSDYLLFPCTKYIPLNTLDASGTVVSACVLQRQELAEQLDLPSEASLVEFAILMGNDYVGNSKEAQLDFVSSNAEEIIEHLREQGPDYQVTSNLSEVQQAMTFTRALYEFEDLSDFPLDRVDTLNADDDDDDSTDSEDDEEEELDRPEMPAGLDLTLATPGPLDFSMYSVIARPIDTYVDNVEEGGIIRRDHLDVFKRMMDSLQKEPSPKLTDSENVRPSWDDVLAAYVIERLIAFVIRMNPASPLVRITSPSRLFHHALFHSLLKEKSENAPLVAPAVTNGTHVEEPEEVERPTLPIDEHEDAIIDAVSSQRVTIIHGETGCGKSSRVPVMLLRSPPPDPSFQTVKMFISQPRRIAAKSLVERVRSCEPDLRLSIALRMGHGVREYENTNTRAWFVTTGYLVRVLANHPEKFNGCSYLIIDEVHERSVDTDILCLLCRRLLDSNRRIRLILMSATMAATLYQQYFGVPEPPIHVGARRFPIKEYFVEDLSRKFHLPATDAKAAAAILRDCEKTRCNTAPTNSYMENLFKLSARLTMCIGRPGSSILIFVPGMNEIISITELIEKQYVPGIRYTCYPIHSDVPFEEQMTAFDSPSSDEVKVVIATNAAESSVTLPDVDHVICLGLCKQIMYNPSSHRQMLMPAWISRASAIQRAGRTGRVRDGNVYRLYSGKAFKECMDEFETGEMLRTPLDSVILTLKEMLNEEATPVLLDCLEPPNVSTIERSFKSLHQSSFITSPDDAGSITSLGKFVSSLGIDLALGSLIGLGIQFGVGAEVIEMAAVLSFPKTPWMMTSPLWHDPPEFNDLSSKTFSSRCHFDANLYSEPLSIMNLMWDYEAAKNQHGWAWHYSVSAPRLRRLVATRNSLRSRVADFAGIDVARLRMEKPPVQMEHAKLTLLRIIQVWVFSDTMIESIHHTKAVNDSMTLSLTGSRITAAHLEQVLDPERHPFSFGSNKEIEQKGSFTPVSDNEFSMNSFTLGFEIRFVSYAVEKELDMFWFSTEDSFHFFVPNRVAESGDFVKEFGEHRLASFNRSYLAALPVQGNRRGRKERPSGLWDIQDTSDSSNEFNDEVVHLTKFFTNDMKAVPKRYLSRHVLDLQEVSASLTCVFTKYKKKKGSCSPTFRLLSRGDCSEVSETDLCDLFATPNVTATVKESKSIQQNITFSPTVNTPIPSYKGKAGYTTGDHNPGSSWHRPLLPDAPEGARILSVLASGRRHKHSVLLSPIESEDSGAENDEGDVSYLEVSLNRDETKISQRWRQLGSTRTVFVAENSVPAAAMSSSGPIEVFACCANTLEVRGGALRVEGVTLLPPGRLFAVLSYVTFGLLPFLSTEIDWGDGTFEKIDDEELFSKAVDWVNTWDAMVSGIGDTPVAIAPDIDREERIESAMRFQETCSDLGEALVCYPDKVRDLCKVFDMVDGYSVVPWETLDDNPFTGENLRIGKAMRQNIGRRAKDNVTSPVEGKPSVRAKKQDAARNSVAPAVNGQVSVTPAVDNQPLVTPNKKKTRRNKRDKAKRTVTPTKKRPEKQKSTNGYRETAIVDTFSDETLSMSTRLFATTLESGETLGEWDLPSTNILCVLVRHYCDFLLEKSLMPEDKEAIELEGRVSLTDQHWLIRSVKDDKGKEWFLAEFVGTIMPFLSVKRRGRIASWIWQGRARPSSVKQALACVPPHFSKAPTFVAKIAFSECDSGKAVFFENLEMALRMEASFWLERQFGDASRHWYQQSLEEMMTKATTLETVVPRDG